MPGGDGAGPWWTNRGWYCRKGFGRSWGIGRGSGFGIGHRDVPLYQIPQVPKETEISELKQYSDELEAELEGVKRRIEYLEKRD